MGRDLSALVCVLAAACGGTEPLRPRPSPDGPTWHADVAPLLAARCSGCHGADGVAENELPLTEYPVARAWAPRLAEVAARGEMPPFPASETEDCPQPWGFAADPRLSLAEVDLLDRWAEAGAPEGDAADATPLIGPDLPILVRHDAVLMPLEPVVLPPADEAADVYFCLVLDPQLNTSVWMTGFEVVPDQVDLLHHAMLGVVSRARASAHDDEDGQVDGRFPCEGLYVVPGTTPFGAWVPGSGATLLPEGSGIELLPDQVVLLSAHYHAALETRTDASGVALQWSAEPTDRRAGVDLRGNCRNAHCGLAPGEGDPEGVPRFLVPAGAHAHTERMRIPWKGGLARGGTLVALIPHMHLQGRAFRAWTERPDGSPGPCLVDVPRWDFDWQLAYTFGDGAPLPVAEDGGALVLECTYDNSLDNPDLVEELTRRGYAEPRPTEVGRGSLDEMCSVALLYLAP